LATLVTGVQTCALPISNTAIYAGGSQWEFKGKTSDALSQDFYYIVPEKCTECVGHFEKEQCAAVCPVDCCVPDPNHTETEDILLARAKEIHPERAFTELGPTTSHFRA
jgi:ferredoxin